MDKDQVSSANRKPMVTGLFDDLESAEYAYSAAAERGYGINLVMSEDTLKRHFHDDADVRSEFGSRATNGGGGGSAIGGTVGAVLAAIAAVGTSFPVPELGIVISGPAAAALASAGPGAVTGGITGALVGAGIPEERATRYREGIKNGGIVIGVTPRNDADAADVEKSWKTRGAHVFR